MTLASAKPHNAAPSNEELIAQHRVAAEALLRRAERSNDFDASRWASLATGHAVLALTYISRPVELDAEALPPDVGLVS